MLQPSRVRFRKTHRGRHEGKALRGNTILLGDFGLQALESDWITARQIEAARRAITHHVRRGGNVWVRIFPDKPITRKPAESHMGGGKGPLDHWAANVKRGRMMFEMSGVSEETAREAMRLASDKLPIDCRFIKRPDLGETVNKESVEVEDEGNQSSK